jgi:hypothetical protein
MPLPTHANPRAAIRRRRAAMLATVGCALAIAACGSSGTPGATTASAGSTQGVKYADCMRSHGVAGFPDPLSGGGFSLPSTINQQSPAYLAASKACATIQPAAQSHATPTEQQKLAGLNLAICVRKHGITDFPDPSLSPPSSNQPTLGRRGLYFTLPTGALQSPAFKHAAAACGFKAP